MTIRKVQESHSRAVLSTWMANAGLLCVMVGTALPLLRVDGDIFKWIYCVGALLTVVAKLMRPVAKHWPLPARRLMRVEIWAALMFCAGGFFMWYPAAGYGTTDWIAFTLAGAAILVYASLMIPRRMAAK